MTTTADNMPKTIRSCQKTNQQVVFIGHQMRTSTSSWAPEIIHPHLAMGQSLSLEPVPVGHSIETTHRLPSKISGN
jgi:hypothetical protein